MPNHYHLLVRSLRGNLSRAMKQLNATYTQRVNLLERWDGPVFRGRFRSQPVQDESNLPYLMAYIHLNPLKAGLVTRLHTHAWTSHQAYLKRETTPSWLSTEYFERVFDDTDHLHEYVLNLHRGKQTWPEKMAMDNGWLKQAGEQAIETTGFNVETRFASPDEVLKRICDSTKSNMKRLRQVEHGPRANPARRFAVWALRDRTQLTHREIGGLLGMSECQVSQVLRRLNTKSEPIRTWISHW
ncbi:MAG: hypothetical protein JRH20_30400 [Deltaproteobacteria bacterium]|nr:hypothetical protein [Deltaproteobacteria bacterium]